MSIIAVGAAELYIEVEEIVTDRWLVRHVADDGRIVEGRIVRFGEMYQLRIAGDLRTRLYAPSFEIALDYFCACIDGSMGRVCARDS